MACEPQRLASDREKPGRRAGGEAGSVALSPRPPRLTGCRSGRQGPASVHEEEGAPGGTHPDFPSSRESGRGRALFVCPRRADWPEGALCPDRSGCLRRRRNAPRPPAGPKQSFARGARAVPGGGGTFSSPSGVSSPLLERRAPAWLGFSSLLVVPDREVDQTKVRVDEMGVTSSPDLAKEICNEKGLSVKY